MLGVRFLQAAALAAGTVGGLSAGAYGLLNGQSRQARSVIGISTQRPLNADGVYLPEDPLPSAGKPIRFAMIGDSSAAGLGARSVDALPGVLLARGLADESGRAVRLCTYAFSGATTRDLEPQVDNALIEPPDVAVVIVGGNDVTTKMRIRTSATLLGIQLRRLRQAGTGVVMCTCPDLGVIKPIPQPLRSIVQRWSLSLSKAQRRAAEAAEATPFCAAELLSPEFRDRPELFSQDRFHPGDAGYQAAASVLLGPVCAAAGIWTTPVVSPPAQTANDS
ncbi:MAG: SGNH/GDSL hydrolase family protein [Pseudonocardiaceae bacterium]|nr:SGNH/GDSL hydrolase family protein [Pseudonocardiaceae bacterium]